MTGKMGNKLCGCGLSLNKTLLSLFAFILPLRVPVTYVSSHGSPPLCVLLSPCSYPPSSSSATSSTMATLTHAAGVGGRDRVAAPGACLRGCVCCA